MSSNQDLRWGTKNPISPPRLMSKSVSKAKEQEKPVDDLALRRYLQLLAMQPAQISRLQGNVSLSNLYNLPIFTDTELVDYVRDQVKTFDDDMLATINEVKNGLGDAIQQVYSIRSDLETNYATVDVIAGTYATQDEVGALYTVTVEANGHVSGYTSVATGTSSVFQIYAEKFAVSSSSTEEGYSPFQIDTVNHKINMTANVAIDGNLLVAGTITAAKIAANTITASQIAADTITANQIAAGTITANEILANTITASEIASNTITSAEMSTNVLLVGGQVKSTNYTWNSGLPVGFGLWAGGDPDSGSAYNIIGGKMFGGTITGTTINASTINIRNLNLINDSNYTVDPFFTITPAMTITGTDPKVFDFLSDMYTYNSTATSTKRTVGTTGTKIFFSELDTTTVAYAPVGYFVIAASDYAMTIDVDIMVGTTTLATRTSFSNNTDYDIGGFVFRLVYDTSATYNYTFCIKASTNDISVGSTSNSPLHISVSVNWSTSVSYRNVGLAWLVSNL